MSNCEWCDKEFVQPKYRTVKFCGKECQVAAYREKAALTLECLNCHKDFKVKKSEGERKYCSQTCYFEHMPENPESIVQPKPSKECLQCGLDFTPRTKNSKFCSKDCDNASRRTLSPKNCLVCGEEFISKSKESKFCSRACYFKNGVTGRTPGETITFICVGCGEECTVPKNYPSAKKYCSNKCAKKEQKKGWSKSGLLLDNGDVLIFRSGYEVRFYAVCLRFNIPIRNYDGPDILTSVGNYRPDFIIDLRGKEYVVEVKGRMMPDAAIKIEEANAQLDNFMLVDKTELLEIENEGF